jgi:glucosamine--fructose-6-phosphate aminotransferase (isomerizing)
MTIGSHTWEEIISQPQTWQLTLEAFSRSEGPLHEFLRQVIFERILVIGCGSTHYLASTTTALIAQCAHIPSRAVPSSELWLYPNMVAPVGTMLIAISRSGTTTETLWALKRFRQTNDGPVLIITCDPHSSLTRGADFVLAAPDAQERSIAQTRSFTSMLLLAQCLVATFARNDEMLDQLHRLPAVLEGVLEKVGQVPVELGQDLAIEQIFFLGSGPLHGLASEAMLKTKEMSLTHSEAYHPMEFRHGPMSMVDERTLVVELCSDTGLTHELQVLKDMQQLGGRTLALIEDAKAFTDWQPDQVIQLGSGLDEWGRIPLYLPVLQRIAYHRARAKKLDPDRPNNLTAVVELQDNEPG